MGDDMFRTGIASSPKVGRYVLTADRVLPPPGTGGDGGESAFSTFMEDVNETKNSFSIKQV
jgi:hypothetical protein